MLIFVTCPPLSAYERSLLIEFWCTVGSFVTSFPPARPRKSIALNIFRALYSCCSPPLPAPAAFSTEPVSCQPLSLPLKR